MKSFFSLGRVLSLLATLMVSYSGIGSASECRITLTKCVKYPFSGSSREFPDNYENASSNPERCLRRAHEYNLGCGNPAGTMVTASYFYDAALKKAPELGVSNIKGCVIEQSQCKKYPGQFVGTFVDNYDNSSQNSDRCMARAGEFAMACGNPIDSSTTATFFGDYSVRLWFGSYLAYTPRTSMPYVVRPPTRVIYRLTYRGTDYLHSWNPSEGTPLFSYEGPAFKLFVSPSGLCSTAINRCRMRGSNQHFLSTTTDCEGQIPEFTLGYACSTGSMYAAGLFRMYNPSTGAHVTTTNMNEYNSNTGAFSGKPGAWKAEGFQGFGE